MIKGVLVLLDNHLPSALASEFASKILLNLESYVDIGRLTISTNSELKRAKKKFKMRDIPALKIEGDGKIYYRDTYEERLRGIVTDVRRKKSNKHQNKAIKSARMDRLRSRHDKANDRDKSGRKFDPGRDGLVLPAVRGESEKDS